ncbi:MAG: hypothetical protein AAFO95_14200, partial [Cyanobacteria bacterium J06600_6]
RLFFSIVWMLILPFSLPILFLFIYPVTTYSFNSEENSFVVAETMLFSTEEIKYALKHLKVIPKTKDKALFIVLTIKDEREYILKEFAREKELPKILKLIKPFIT